MLPTNEESFWWARRSGDAGGFDTGVRNGWRTGSPVSKCTEKSARGRTVGLVAVMFGSLPSIWFVTDTGRFLEVAEQK